jgi:hypothetical protein
MMSGDLDQESAERIQALDAELLDEFNRTCEDSLSPQTIRSYNSVFKRFVQFCKVMEYKVFLDGELKLADVTYTMIASFFAQNAYHTKGKNVGTLKSKSTPESFRNALVYHFNRSKLDMPGDIYALTKKFITAVNRKRKRDQNEGIAESNARCEATMKENEVIYTIFLLI